MKHADPARRPFDPRLMVKGDLPLEIERLSHRVIGCAIEVHRHLGPGLLEGIYEDALAYELQAAGIAFGRQVEIAIPYKTTVLRGHKLDLIVEDSVIVELKSVTAVVDVHRAQLLSYLRATHKPLGLLMNFNVATLRDGLDRLLNERAIPRGASPTPSSCSSRPSRSIP